MTDYRLLLLGRVLRAFGFGSSAVLLGLHLERHGLKPAEIGLCLTIGLLAAALSGLAAASLSRRFGRRAVLALVGLLMALTGLVLVAAPGRLVLILSGATGMLGAAGLDLGPFLAIEQPMLAESVGPERRNLAFARYSLSGALAGAAGGFAASFATDVRLSGLFFLVFAAVGVLTAGCRSCFRRGSRRRRWSRFASSRGRSWAWRRSSGWTRSAAASSPTR